MLYDPNGLYAVIKGRQLEGGTPTYYSDGIRQSDELLELCKSQISIPEEYEHFHLTVQSLGKIFKKTDRSLEYADKFLNKFAITGASTIYPPLGLTLEAITFVSDICKNDNPAVFPDSYYYTYKITMSWTEEYHWTGGTTYTYASYEFLVCWDTNTYEDKDVWQLYTAQNNSYSKVVYD